MTRIQNGPSPDFHSQNIKYNYKYFCGWQSILENSIGNFKESLKEAKINFLGGTQWFEIF